MTLSLVDPRHLAFVLDDVLDAEAVLSLPAFAGQTRADAAAILDTAERLARERFQPSFSALDAQEPVMENGRVVLPKAIDEGLAAFREAGFFGMAADPEHGGLGLPRLIANAAFLWFQAANVSLANYALLTMGAAELLAHHATPEQKRRYLEPMIEGRFLGTMALSEPHAGSSLGDIKTRATPRPDGRYALSGTKMWISGGEHDLSENIVHLMLARIDGAPAGVKGISLFIVPRKRLDADGRPVEWNHIALAGLNHKMGQRGTVNTVLNVGENGETIGEIVGAPGQGLACMFTMMNEARVGVSMGAVGHASAAYLHSLGYARDRLQGRLPDSKDPAAPQVPIIAHADVRRMLLQQKAAAEGGIAFGLHLAKLGDLKKAAQSESERQDATLLLDFLTPIFKAWVSEETLAANYNAIQVLGGAGYTRDHPVEQHYRDNRLNPIHEGTNGIQAMDLLGRKAIMAEGRALALFFDWLADAKQRAAAADLGELATALTSAEAHMRQAKADLDRIRTTSGATAVLAYATDYMAIAGAAAFARIWTDIAVAAVKKRPTMPASEQGFYDGKIAAARYVVEHVIPRAVAAAARIAGEHNSSLRMADAHF